VEPFGFAAEGLEVAFSKGVIKDNPIGVADIR
jgi:hypothetical protein